MKIIISILVDLWIISEEILKYFQGAINSKDEDEMLDSLDKALLEIEQGNKWL